MSSTDGSKPPLLMKKNISEIAPGSYNALDIISKFQKQNTHLPSINEPILDVDEPSSLNNSSIKEESKSSEDLP